MKSRNLEAVNVRFVGWGRNMLPETVPSRGKAPARRNGVRSQGRVGVRGAAGIGAPKSISEKSRRFSYGAFGKVMSPATALGAGRR